MKAPAPVKFVLSIFILAVLLSCDKIRESVEEKIDQQVNERLEEEIRKIDTVRMKLDSLTLDTLHKRLDSLVKDLKLDTLKSHIDKNLKKKNQ